MATFYIDSPSRGILELTSTTDIEVVESSSLTKYKVESGETISDNVVVENVTVKFNGLISEIVRLDYTNTQRDYKSQNNYNNQVQGYIEDLRAIKNSKELFKVRYDGRFPVLSNCVLTSLNISRDASTGLGYQVNLSFEQVRIAKQISLSIKMQDQKQPNDTQGKTKSGSNSTQEIVISPSGKDIDEGQSYVYKSGERGSGVLADIELVSE